MRRIVGTLRVYHNPGGGFISSLWHIESKVRFAASANVSTRVGRRRPVKRIGRVTGQAAIKNAFACIGSA